MVYLHFLRDGTVGWNPSSLNTKTRLSFLVSNMDADVHATERVTASVAIILTLLS